jgi:hypothetical protein
MFLIPKNSHIHNNKSKNLKNDIKMKENNEELVKCIKYANHIISINFFSINEIEISQRILREPNYSSYFNPILKSSIVNLSEIDDECFERCEEMKDNSNSRFLIKKLNITKNPSFFKVFYSTPIENPKKCVLNLINSYKHLLESIKILEKHEIINFNFHPTNIIYRNNRPVLVNLSDMLHTPTINNERKCNLFSINNEKNVFLPPEAIIICFLLKNDCSSLSFSNIEEIIMNYSQNITSLNLFSEVFIEKLKETTSFYLRCLINKSRESIIDDILKSNSIITWNNYGLSVLFLLLMRDIFRDFGGFPQNAFISSFFDILSQNISPPNSDKRITAYQMVDIFNDILYKTDKEVFFQLFIYLS